MAANPEATFIEQWNDEALQEFQQMKSLVFDTVTIRQKRGKSLHVPVWGSSEANTGRTRHQQLTISAQNSTEVEIVPELVYKMFFIDDFDQAKTDYDYRRDLSVQAAAAVWRGFDDVVIAAMNASTNAEIVLPTVNQFTYSGAEVMAKVLDQGEVFEQGRFGLVSSGAKQDLRNDTVYINNFHAPNSTVQKGMLTDVAGLDLVTSQRLPNGDAGVTERRNFVYHKSAVVVHINSPFRLRFDWENDYQSWSLVASLGVGAEIVQQPGVQFCDVTE